MPVADTSQTERIRRLKAKIQAVRRAECAACPELGPQGPTSESVRLSRSFGQMTYYRQLPSGAVQAECCGAQPVPTCGRTVQTDPNTLVTVTNNTEVNVYVTFTPVGVYKPRELAPGQSTTALGITSYTINCINYIYLTCSNVGEVVPLTPGYFNIFTNTANVPIGFEVTNGILTFPILLVPMQSSIFLTLTLISYRIIICGNPTNIELTCDQTITLSQPSILTFTNNTLFNIVLTLNYTYYADIIFIPANTSIPVGPFLNIPSYTTSCELIEGIAPLINGREYRFTNNTTGEIMIGNLKIPVGKSQYRYNKYKKTFTPVSVAEPYALLNIEDIAVVEKKEY